MYYPKQIPYILDREFQEHIEYKEYLFKELNDYCMCIWQMHSKRILNKTIYNYIDIILFFHYFYNKNLYFLLIHSL